MRSRNDAPTISFGDLGKDIGSDIVKHAALAVLSGCLASGIGIFKRFDMTDPANWPVWLVVAATIICLLALTRLGSAVLKRRERAKVGRVSGDRLAVLLPRLRGDDDDASMRETIREGIKREFGDSIDISLWPEPLFVPEGRDTDGQLQAERTAQEWLRVTACDLIVWGRVRGAQSVTLRVAGSDGPSLLQTYVLNPPTADLPDNFARDLTASIVDRAIIEAKPASRGGQGPKEQLKRVAERMEALLQGVSSPKAVT